MVLDDDHVCGDSEAYTLARFLFVFLSSGAAFAGFIGNALLLKLFVTKHSSKTPTTLYPGMLAVLDGLICGMYILLFGADAVIGFLHLKGLFVIYHLYFVPAFFVARVTQLAIPYMLIFATLERYVWISGKSQCNFLQKMCSNRGRLITLSITLAVCIGARLPIFWAITVYDYPTCDDFFRSQAADSALWVRESHFYYVYDFHLLSITQTVIPFFVLLFTNAVIVHRLTRSRDQEVGTVLPVGPPIGEVYPNHHTGVTVVCNGEGEKKVALAVMCLGDDDSKPPSPPPPTTPAPPPKKISHHTTSPAVKSAISTMVAIVASYLVSNTLHLILTALERSNSDILRHPDDPKLASAFHTAFSDIVSFVYMFTSAIRIAIYYVCNPTIRRNIQEFFTSDSPKKMPNSAVSV